MTNDDLKRITSILKPDLKYRHLGDRVGKDFQNSIEKGIPVAMKVFFAKEDGVDAAFAVIAISPLKMKQWEQIFIEEAWVKPGFKTGIASFELMYLYVSEDLRRKGLGSKLFAKVKNYAQKTGINSIYAYVGDIKDHALKFYLKEGAEVISNFSEAGYTTAFLVWKNISKANR